MSITIKNKILFFELSLIILLKIVLDYGYYFTNRKITHYYIFDFDLVNYSLGWFFTFLIYLFLFYKRNIKISIVFLLIFILYILPNIVYYGLSNKSLTFLLYLLIPFSFILFSIKNLELQKKVKYLVDLKYILAISVITSLIVLFHLIWSSAGDFVLNPLAVYSFREKYENINSIGAWAYINSWTFRIFVVFLLVYFLYIKSYLSLLNTILLVFLFFIFTGHKSIFLSIFLVLFFFFIYKTNWNRIIIISSFILFFFTIILYCNVTKDVLLGAIFIKRLLFVPSVLSFTYFEFFSNNELLYWSNGVLKNFYEYPYEKNFTLLIGEFLNMPRTNANIGFLPMGYAHASFFGIFIYTIIASIILNMINWFISEDTKFIKISISFLPIYIFFTTSDLLTTFLTHGLFLSLLLVVFLSINLKKGKYHDSNT